LNLAKEISMRTTLTVLLIMLATHSYSHPLEKFVFSACVPRENSVVAVNVDPHNKNRSVHAFTPNASTWRLDGNTFEQLLSDDNGAIYFGEIEGGVASGQGTLKCPNGDTYSGRFYDGKFLLSGLASISYSNGDHYSGAISLGRPYGHGTLAKSNGAVYEGNFYIGRLHGMGEYSVGDITITSEQWRHGLLDGEGKIYWASGAKYEGEIQGTERHGNGVFTHSNGTTIESENWVQGHVIGYGTILWKKGGRYEGEMRGANNRSYRHGTGTYTTANGTVYFSENWSDDKIYGEGKITRSNGDYYEGEIKGFDRHGKGEDRLILGDDIAIWRGMYENNLRQGEHWFQVVAQDFKLAFVSNYVDGAAHGRTYGYKFGIAATKRIKLFDQLLKLPATSSVLKENKIFSDANYENGELRSEAGSIDDVLTYEENILLDDRSIEIKYFDSTSLVWGQIKEIDNVEKISGDAIINYPDGSVYVGQIKDNLEHGVGILKPAKFADSGRELPISVGSWENGEPTGKGYLIDVEMQRVRYCKDISDPLLNCTSNSFVEWYFPIRQYFGFADFLAPRAKMAVEKLSWEDKARLGIQNWSFETFFQLLVLNVGILNSVEINSEAGINYLRDIEPSEKLSSLKEATFRMLQ
jgi:hypothetical protein